MSPISDHPAIARRDAGSLLSLAQRSTELRSKAGLRRWLECEVQEFIPHAFVVVAWGDLDGEGGSHELISAHTTLDPHLGPAEHWVARHHGSRCHVAIINLNFGFFGL